MRAEADSKQQHHIKLRAGQPARRQPLGLWFPLPPEGYGKAAKRRMIVSHFLNGCWTMKAVEHWCPDGCCATEQDAIDSMLRLLPAALLPYSSARMSQNRWTKLIELQQCDEPHRCKLVSLMVASRPCMLKPGRAEKTHGCLSATRLELLSLP